MLIVNLTGLRDTGLEDQHSTVLGVSVQCYQRKRACRPAKGQGKIRPGHVWPHPVGLQPGGMRRGRKNNSGCANKVASA